MTYGQLKSLVRALLIGDNMLTQNDDEIKMLLDYAYERIANEADALKLFTLNENEQPIIRMGPGNIWVRKPALPETDDDELDVDHELAFAVARYICSFVTRERQQLHLMEAKNIINSYNHKVEQFYESIDQDGLLSQFDQYDMYGKRYYPQTETGTEVLSDA